MPSLRDNGISRRTRTLLISLGVAIAAVAGGLIWFFGGNAPGEVDLAQTAEAVTATTIESPAETTEDTGAVSTTVDTTTEEGGIAGIWSVDTSVGEFTVEEDTTATFAGFRVNEVLDTIGATVAVGRTPEVGGTITIEGTTLTSAEVTADLTAIESNERRREGAIQRALGTSANPTATFVLSQPIELGEAAAAGDPVSVTADGDLTINGVTSPVSMDLEAQLIDGRVLVTGSSDVVFADYEVAAPSAPIVLSVEEEGVIEFQVWFSR